MRTAALLLAAASLMPAQAAKRLVIVKVDGLPQDVVERDIGELPWIRSIFVEHGAVVRNFYVRGISLSAPSWQMLDTGQHMVIRGNAEFDRNNPAHVYDYLNFFPFYVGYARSKRTAMPGVDVLDECGIPLLIDRFAPDGRYQSMQLYQRGVHWQTLGDSVKARFEKSAHQLIDESQTGFDLGAGIYEQEEKELIAALANPKIAYLDYYTGDFDHTAHLTNDPAVQLRVLRHLDALLGRIWTAIEASPLAGETVLAMVSDHGMNSTPGTYSQGYDLVKFLNSPEGGGNAVITDRHPMDEYKLKGLNPFVSYVKTGSGPPTATIDPDGNERAAIQFLPGAKKMDYFGALTAIRVRNVVQQGVGASPVDFVAAKRADGSVLLYGDAMHQAVLEMKDGMLRYSPLTGQPEPGYPLHLYEDGVWLDGWHSEEEWFEAIHKAKYSNGLIGLSEYFRPCSLQHCRETDVDMLVFASDHWNFNVRGFNPGGNHGSFLRVSTHSVFMMAGAGIPAGLEIERPYDSLSFVPTMLHLLGRDERDLPGRAITELDGQPVLSGAGSGLGNGKRPAARL